MSRLIKKEARVDLFGKAVIPAGTTEIADRTFDGNEKLKQIFIPGSVKVIGDRVFADCPNLTEVIFQEGLESIGRNTFTGCSSLKELVIPDSVRELDGWAFYHFTGLEKPVFNQSGTILYAYPCTAKEKSYQIPENIQNINPAAFLDNLYLEELVLPEGIVCLEQRTVLDCAIRRIIIPESVKRIKSRAFWGCKNLREVLVLGENTVVEDGAFYNCSRTMEILTHQELRIDQHLHLIGGTFLKRVHLEYPDGSHCLDRAFRDCAQKCAEGDVNARWNLAKYFDNRGKGLFWQCASNFWKYRACQKGHPEAEIWLNEWIKEHPGKGMESVLTESLSGSISGRTLYYSGFLFFDPERSYTLDAVDQDGIVQVSSWSSDDGPDEDGFGREEYYDWWYLNENLCEIPGIGMLHDYSHLDKRNNEEAFQALHDRAAQRIREKSAFRRQ